MTPSKQVLNAILQQHFASFVARTFEAVCPSDRFLPNWHIDVIADHLEQAYRGDINRLIITMPPRSLKSICASVAFTCWALGKNPSLRIICVSYSYDLAIKFARDCQAIMESDWYRSLFPETRLLRSSEQELVTTLNGGRYTTSVGGTLTGRGGNIILIDDPMKPQDGQSESARKMVQQWFNNTLFSRLDSKANDVIILVMQRLHEDDLAAHLLNTGEWVHLNLPAIATNDETFVLQDGRRIERKVGDALHPEREPLDVLEETRKYMGTPDFEAQYQQQPMPTDGNLIQWSWFSFYDTPPPNDSGKMVVQSWDTATKNTEFSDYSVCTTWLIKGSDYYLLDVLREKLNYPELRHAVYKNSEKYRPDVILIEDTGSGSALLQDYQHRQLRGTAPLKPITPKGDKNMRMSAQSAKIEAGHVYLPRQAPWLEEFQKELMSFPRGKHDDQVDSLSQFLNWRNNRPRVHERKLSGL